MRVVTPALTEEQKEALVDLLILGMYADRKLACAEEEYLNRLLDTFPFDSEYDRQVFADAAFARVRRHSGSRRTLRRYIAELAESFPTDDDRQMAYDRLAELLSKAGSHAYEEREMLALVRAVFRLRS